MKEDQPNYEKQEVRGPPVFLLLTWHLPILVNFSSSSSIFGNDGHLGWEVRQI